MLPGRPGAGRKSATKIISMISNLRLIDSAPGNKFHENLISVNLFMMIYDFLGKGRASVKSAVQAAGIDGEYVILLLEEHHLRDEEFAILASAIISRGELPGLYSSEELDGIIAPLSEIALTDEFSGTLDQYLYYRKIST